MTTEPTQWSRNLVRGAVDLHVHAGPDAVPRIEDAQTIADNFTDCGLAGFVDKNHFIPTVNKGVKTKTCGARHLSSIVLNGFVGGLNPLAVDIAATCGAKMVWMPTVDIEMTPEAAALRLQGTASSWSAIRDDLLDRGLARNRDPITSTDGGPSTELLAVLEVVRDRDLTLATGHLRFGETMVVVQAAVTMGIQRLVVTHPEFPAQKFSVDEQRELAALGATLEYCYTTAATGKTSWRSWLEGIRALPTENVVVSSDSGQISNPAVEDCLPLAAMAMSNAGLSDHSIQAIIVDNSRRLANFQ
ncbi:DUF6282 family protein [Brevibacterium sp. FAM 24638]|uniref:DUF6282 family protein n=1 Tax=unclassified Brevibacterium TaxID=2614124 RepID=UPI003C7C5F97